MPRRSGRAATASPSLDLIERAATRSGTFGGRLQLSRTIWKERRPKEIRAKLDGLGISLNGFAMRYYSDPGFKKGALSHP